LAADAPKTEDVDAELISGNTGVETLAAATGVLTEAPKEEVHATGTDADISGGKG